MSLLLALIPMMQSAQASGGYDYNFADVEWFTLETEHFLFHYPKSTLPTTDPHYFTTEFTVSRLSVIAEQSHDKICEQLDFFPKEKTHVVIYDQDIGWEGNGFALAEMDWTGFSADWGPLFRMRGRMEFLSDVFVHEYAHIVSLKAFLPWSESSTYMEMGGLIEDEEWLKRWGVSPQQSINFDIGFSGIMSVHTPFWWAEGGAEYWSHNAGYNFWGNSREAFLRTTFLEERQLDLNEWTTVANKKGFDGERGYNQGYDFGLFLQRKLERDVMSEMAKISGERWHWSWDAVVEEATKIPMEDLYADWVVENTARFTKTLKNVEKEGRVEGKEMSLHQPEWEQTSEAGLQSWNSLSRSEQEEMMDGVTAYQEFPRYSPNGKYISWFESGLNVMEISPDEWGAISGKYVDLKDRKTQKEYWNKKWYSNDWIRPFPVNWSPDSTKIVAVGFEDWRGQFQMNQGLQFNANGYNWNQLIVGTLQERMEGSNKKLDIKWETIPNTLRAQEATWSPDGTRIAFVKYSDGTHNLWTIDADGNNAMQLTHFGDGTQVQGLNWCLIEDKDTLVMALYRNDKQEIWSFDLNAQEWKQWTDNDLDETDPYIGPDKQLWFSSNKDGIFNVFSMDMQGNVKQHSNVVGSVYGVDVTKEGHVLYTDFTGHGFRIKMLPQDKIWNKEVSYPGVLLSEQNAVGKDTAISEQPPEKPIVEQSIPYRKKNGQFPFSLMPIARTTDKNVEFGNYFFLGDVIEEHYLEAMATFGKDNYLYVNYWNDQFWPSLSLGYSRYAYKGDYGYGDDIDGNPNTDDLRIVDVKFEQLADDVWLSASFVPSYALWTSVFVDASRYQFRDNGDGDNWVPYQIASGIGTYIEWSPRGGYYYGDDWINPRGGRRVYVDYSYRWSKIIDPELAGGIFDNGMWLEDYTYNRLQMSWTEFVPVPLTEHHTFQLDFDIGYIDRNVMGWDEFMAGGRHPYNWGNGTIGNNIQFSGFEGYSLSGETMLIANAAYRFPVWRDMNQKWGPIYMDSLYLQFFGSIGNLWSYRVEGETHVEGYSVVPSDGGSVRREIPFVDYSSKNSTPFEKHYFLTDIGTELRMRSFMWNDWDWDGFLRVSYGLQSTAGYGDVNADFIQSSLARDAASELSAEYEEPTIRVYLGLGTGW